MKFDAQDCLLVKKEQLTETIFDVTLQNEVLASLCRPGQFAHVLVPGKTLRRPISICQAGNGILRLVFEVRGEGTRVLSELPVGSTVNVIAPLGNGFDLPENGQVVLVGGGIGVPPMLYAADFLGNRATVINGFRDKSAVILTKDFQASGCRLIETTDNGSYGIHGFVTGPLKEVISGADLVCACGPAPMLKNVAAVAQQFHVPCQVSLEQRMACGVGACLGCAVAIKRKEGGFAYRHVCKDGPVFAAEEVEWNG